MPTVAGYASAGTSSESGTDHGYFPGLSTADSMIARPSSSMLTMAKTDVPSGWTFTRSPGVTVVPLSSTREKGTCHFRSSTGNFTGPPTKLFRGPRVSGQLVRRRARSRTASRRTGRDRAARGRSALRAPARCRVDRPVRGTRRRLSSQGAWARPFSDIRFQHHRGPCLPPQSLEHSLSAGRGGIHRRRPCRSGGGLSTGAAYRVAPG